MSLVLERQKNSIQFAPVHEVRGYLIKYTTTELGCGGVPLYFDYHIDQKFCDDLKTIRPKNVNQFLLKYQTKILETQQNSVSIGILSLTP